MMKKWCMAGLAICLILAVCGCSKSGTDAATGKTAVISLPANSSTGYAWDYIQWADNEQGEAEAEDEFFDVTENYIQGESEEPMVGVPGTMEYTLTAKKEGKCEIDLAYAQGMDQGIYQVNYLFEVDADMNISFIEKKVIQLDESVELPELPDPVLK